MFRRDGRSGFTLLELLIVVIIVSILAAVALPRFGKMTARAKAAEAVNTIGSYLTAESLYYQEYDTFGAAANLTVDADQTKFTYTVTANGTTNAQVSAAPNANQNVDGINVVGTVYPTGRRTILVN